MTNTFLSQEGSDLIYGALELVCTHPGTTHQLRIIPTNRADPLYPKFIPQIKASCSACGKYLRFAKQTPDLVETFNQFLKEKFI